MRSLRNLFGLLVVSIALANLATQAAAAEHAAKAPTAEPRAGGAPVGLEVYSLRALASHDLPAALALTKKMGFTDVETARSYGQHTAAEMRHMLDGLGLTCSSIHASYDDLASGLDGVARDAKTLGASYVVVAWIPHVGPFTESVARSAIANFNKWGDALKKQGLHFCYHPHGYEFAPPKDSGNGTLFDLIASKTKAGTVDFELDIFWAWHAGQDPVALMRKYPDRFPLLHLKDMQKGVPTGVFTGKLPGNDSVVLGHGQLDMPAILKEAAAIGVKESYVEDEADNASSQIPLSMEYLKSLER